MSSWIIKTAVQRVLSWLPWSDRWNELLQRHVTGGLRLEVDDEFLEKILACRHHLTNFRRYTTRPRNDISVLEIGTGWFPIIPIGLYLTGAREIWTYDIVRLLRTDTFYRVIECFAQLYNAGQLTELLPGILPDRARRLCEFLHLHPRPQPEACLESLGIHARVGDIRQTGLPSGSIDFVFSHGVLEHFQLQPLMDSLMELRRVSSADSVMSHYIGMADQFASFDRSITAFNFLRYSSKSWRWLDNPMIPQNRLRSSDYRKAFSSAGFFICGCEDVKGKGEDLDRVALAPEFTKYEKEDLLILFSWMISRPNSQLGAGAPGDETENRNQICVESLKQ